ERARAPENMKRRQRATRAVKARVRAVGDRRDTAGPEADGVVELRAEQPATEACPPGSRLWEGPLEPPLAHVRRGLDHVEIEGDVEIVDRREVLEIDTPGHHHVVVGVEAGLAEVERPDVLAVEPWRGGQ